MTTQYWLVKQEPETYSWDDFVRDGRATWDGVRNYAARNNLKAMRTGDKVLYYHSGEAKCIVGLARVTQPAFPDPTATSPVYPPPAAPKVYTPMARDQGWVAVALAPVAPLPRPVSLAEIKADKSLKDIALVRQSRLSVMPLPSAAFARLCKLGGL